MSGLYPFSFGHGCDTNTNKHAYIRANIGIPTDCAPLAYSKMQNLF